jgi:hypothetical protein
MKHDYYYVTVFIARSRDKCNNGYIPLYMRYE